MPAGQAVDGFPGISWSGTFDNPGTWGGYAWNNKINNTYSLSDNLQWVFGKHNFTFGGQFVDQQFNYYKVVSPSGPMGFSFSSAQTANYTSGSSTNSNAGYSFASYLLGAASAGSTSANVPGLGTRWLDPSFWVEDDFKVSPRLTLNMGLRWDIYPSIKEAHNIFSFLNPNGVNSVTGNKGTLEFAGNGDPALYCNCRITVAHFDEELWSASWFCILGESEDRGPGQLQRQHRTRRLDQRKPVRLSRNAGFHSRRVGSGRGQWRSCVLLG